ncbi:reducing type I polyketide synthase [Trichoderma camerunense]
MAVDTKPSQAPIAVVGMACRLPGHSNSLQSLWEMLERGGIAKVTPPQSRFNLSGHYNGTGSPHTMKSPGGMFLEDIELDRFDAQFFNISRAESMSMDPQQRQLLEVLYECLENAGIPMERIRGTNAVTGILIPPLVLRYLDYEVLMGRDPENRSDSAVAGIHGSFLSNRIAHFLNIYGPTMKVDTACSASLVSLDVACLYLSTNKSLEGMIVAGSNLWFNPEFNEEVGLMRGAQSATARCHTFDAKADGYVKAEGVNALYIKRLDDALRDGDPIRAIIRGTATNASGHTPGITTPSAAAQAAVIRAAYANAGISDFDQTTYFECHGTGTLVGDPIEVNGVASVFATSRPEARPLLIGSIKGNVGHSEAAAGLSGLIKVALAMEKKLIPGNPLFVDPNPRIDFESLRVRAMRKTIPWPSGSKLRSSVNSFGFGGSNAHAVLEAPNSSPHTTSYNKGFSDLDDLFDDYARRPVVLAFSASTEDALKRNIHAISAHAVNPRVNISLNDLAYTLSERRSGLFYRAFVPTQSLDFPITSAIYGKVRSQKPRISFVFTGQGAQWSQMGSALLTAFPSAVNLVKKMDAVLQSMSAPFAPEWSLLTELTEPRTSETMRRPEFSQPLVTTLQLVLLDILSDWGVKPVSVIGHSSGEIAAAVASGLLTPEDAIKVAYLRGQAAKDAHSAIKVGMLAVGVNSDMIKDYIDPKDDLVQVACFNSPESLTLSGTVAALERVQQRLKADNKFARLLHVDMAYHSKYMDKIGQRYLEMLQEQQPPIQPMQGTNLIEMFSSTTGSLLDRDVDATYWTTNMTSSVQFCQAATHMLQGDRAVDFIIELGPSGALSGPISQIRKSLQDEIPFFQYSSTLKRDTEPLSPLFEMAGRLFLAGGSINLAKVNQHPAFGAPSFIVDLPNYSWSHEKSYWHESTASKDWRFRKFATHDLLGSKVLGTPWVAPTFNRILKLDELSWLQDYKIGQNVVMGEACYLSMAMEAYYQTMCMTEWTTALPKCFCYRLKHVRFSQQLVVDHSNGIQIMVSLTPISRSPSWYDFTVRSLHKDQWRKHCSGQIQAGIGTNQQLMNSADGDAGKPLQHEVPGQQWYKALSDAGLDIGPQLQKLLAVESTVGQSQCRSTVSLVAPASNHGQSNYAIHPACLDACLFKAAIPSLCRGERDAMRWVPAAAEIDHLAIMVRSDMPVEVIAIANSTAPIEEDITPQASSSVYDTRDGSPVAEMTGCRFIYLSYQPPKPATHQYSFVSHKPDFNILQSSPELLKRYLSTLPEDETPFSKVQVVLDLMVHKSPFLKVAELNMNYQDTSSLWLETSNPMRALHVGYHLICSSLDGLAKAEEMHSGKSAVTKFSLLNSSGMEANTLEESYDLVILKFSSEKTDDVVLQSVLQTTRKSLADHGILLLVDTSPGERPENHKPQLQSSGFRNIISVELLPHNHVFHLETPALATTVHGANGTSPRPIICVSLLEETSAVVLETRNGLQEYGWSVQESTDVLKDISSCTNVLIMDELSTVVMDRLTQRQLQILQHLIETQCNILWISSGGQLDVTNPRAAISTGFFRSLRAEEPLLTLMVLDVESPSAISQNAASIATCLAKMEQQKPKQQMESEFVERCGLIYVSRILPDEALNRMGHDKPSTIISTKKWLHASKARLEMMAEEPGNLETLRFVETSDESPFPLMTSDWVEVELYAAGLNTEDDRLTTIEEEGKDRGVPIAKEAAGIVTKVAPDVDCLTVGQRVLVLAIGCLANRVRVPVSSVYAIPEDLSFERAVSFPTAYMSAFSCIFSLANLQRGQRILIHSAETSFGLVAVQLSLVKGAVVFATVETDQQRQFLRDTLGMTDGHIFSSHSLEFAFQIRRITKGRGVDIVLNCLDGDSFDESWALVADDGILLDIRSKKTLAQQGPLSIEPFSKGVSYKVFDPSCRSLSAQEQQSLLTKLFQQLLSGDLKLQPQSKCYSYADAVAAFRSQVSQNGIEKIILSETPGKDVLVPTGSEMKRSMKLRDDACYLLVGGLKGICAPLAIYLAKHGAKFLAVLCRSNYDDQKSARAIKDIRAVGCHVDLFQGDVTRFEDVQRVYRDAQRPIAGVVQASMVLRDRPFAKMTAEEYHEVLACKVEGSWNLHSVSESMGLELDFFTMFSAALSGVCSHKGQANYSAGNTFQDALAGYRLRLGKRACTVDLGLVEDAGYVHEHQGLERWFAMSWTPIRESLLSQILGFSVLRQEQDPAATIPSVPVLSTSGQLITGIKIPQDAESDLLLDARFAALFQAHEAEKDTESGRQGRSMVGIVKTMLESTTYDIKAKLSALLNVAKEHIVKILQIKDLEVDRPFGVYGVDSLLAVEIRNWFQLQFGAHLATRDIVDAESLTSLCIKAIGSLAIA